MVVHVFGNSHVYHSFGGISFCATHYLPATMMYHIGKMGLQVLDITKYGVCEGDTAVYTFGCLDARAHIGKQRDREGRNLDEIIQTLCVNYLATILRNAAQFKKLETVVSTVFPPTDTVDPQYLYGTLEDRVHITQKMNRKLRELAFANGVKFLDLYTAFSGSDGSLNHSLSDGDVHVRGEFQGMTQALLETLLGISPVTAEFEPPKGGGQTFDGAKSSVRIVKKVDVTSSLYPRA